VKPTLEQDAAFRRVVETARHLVRTADEFDFDPEALAAACSEYLAAHRDALDAFEATCDVDPDGAVAEALAPACPTLDGGH
jgi:hypothetical protein